MKRMKIGVIGYRNHAERLRGLFLAHADVAAVGVYHPDPDKLIGVAGGDKRVSVVADFEALAGYDAVVVASPSESHGEYLRLLAESETYVFCEKAPVTTFDEVAWLRGLGAARQGRFFFHFNYPFTDFSRTAEARLRDGALGRPVAAQFTATHGLAFKERFAANWRLQESGVFSRVLGNLGIHFVHLALALLGEVEGAHACERKISEHGVNPDTVKISLTHRGGVTVDILLSYAAPYVNQARLVLTDGLVEMDDGVVSEAAPRDSFDADGRFSPPPRRVDSQAASSKDYYDASISRAISAFLATVKAGDATDAVLFEAGLRATELIIKLGEDGVA